jgi:hypothetical protein
MPTTETSRGAVSGAPFITVTGADEKTDVSMLQTLDAEIGLLYSVMTANRYPRSEWIKAAAGSLPRVAIHICGSGARGELLLVLNRLDMRVDLARRIWHWSCPTLR